MWWQLVQDVDDPDTPELWLLQNILSWSGELRVADFPDQAVRLKFWRERGERFAEPWRSVARNLPDGLSFGVDRTTVWTPVDWSASPLAGKVTLAGDAARCMPAHRDQGLNNALEDAARLVEQLTEVLQGQKSVHTALTDFELEMRQRVGVEIPISVMQAKMVHDFENLVEAPMFKMGMNKYRQKQAQKAKEGSS